jgi:sulfur-oxidizing protein SoxA
LTPVAEFDVEAAGYGSAAEIPTGGNVMKKLCTLLAILGLAGAASLTAQADPQTDLKEFQGYFKNKFPEVAFKEYANGVYALDANARGQWESMMDFPPYEIELESGKTLWNKPFKNGKNFASCFTREPQNYPYWDDATNQIRTIELDVNACLKKNGEAEIADLDKGTMVNLVAYFKSMHRGKLVKIDLSNPKAVQAYEQGKQFYWARRGQLNFSCSTCHVDNAGRFLRGESLSAGLGHGTGFPTYRAKDGFMASLHNRYAGCNKQVRAAAFKSQSDEYKNLELYESYMNTGLPLTAPSYRR